MFCLSDYSYELPPEKIAQAPCHDREMAKLLHVDRKSGRLGHFLFRDIAALLEKGDLLVINDTKVVPARLFGHKETGGRIEIFILDYAAGMKNLEQTGFFRCDCLVRASKAPKKGARLFLPDNVEAVVESVKDNFFDIRFLNADSFEQFLNRYGQVPLPPYIKRNTDNSSSDSDRTDYQTVYAAKEGAVAAPTAGLHFTGELMDNLKSKGIEFAAITLHVGYGTFVPVKVDDIREHRIHSEYFVLSPDQADRINSVKRRGGRIVAVGTTSVRTLEFASDENGMVAPGSGMCDLFIYPGYRFKCVDAMITNFHLPESTLLMLVSAFYTREKMLDVYEHAKDKGYRFFSYGDAMLIE